MKEHGCLFTAPNVCAIGADLKNQTRRLITDRNSLGNVKPSQCDMARAFVDPGPSPAGNRGPYLKAPVVRDRRGNTHDEDGHCIADDGIIERIYSRWNVGDRLWVRETFFDHGDFSFAKATKEERVEYRATPWDRKGDPEDAGGWTSPIHMPRWASRYLLDITELRIQRLQDIDWRDAIAEGVDVVRCEHPDPDPNWGCSDCMNTGVLEDPTHAFTDLWISINGAESWEANPFVRAFTFKRIVA